MTYLRLLRAFFRIGLIGEAAYRVQFFLQMFQSLLELATALAGLSVIFAHAQTLGDWRPDEVLALVGVYFLVGGWIGVVVQPSMEELITAVREGTLDFTLVKPEDAQLLVSIIYSFWLILATLAFWFVRVENILEVFQSMYEAGRWPISLYPGWLRFALTFIVPVAFAVTVPAEALTGRLDSTTILGTAGLAAALFVISRMVWIAGLRKYSGASA
jgi:ABC-2 type transport system permease protein